MNGAPTAAGRWVSAINFYYAAPVHYLLIELPLRVVWSLPGAAAAPPAPRARRAAGVEGWNKYCPSSARQPEQSCHQQCTRFSPSAAPE
jgi:hypothetical protein